MNILTIQNLQKSYKDVVAVNGIDLSIPIGISYGILGPNGAGKSTLINCILGLSSYDNGKVIYADQYDIKHWNTKIGYVPQEIAIYPDLTPVENIRFFASLYGLKGGGLNEKIDQAIDFVGLSDVKNKKSGEFSGGMKRRLNLACAIAHSPELIIMDEPTVGIDPQSRNRILENVKYLNDKGTTIIYTTHYMPEVEAICDRIAVMDHGVIKAEGTKQEILKLMDHDDMLTIKIKGQDFSLETLVKEIKSLESVNNVNLENEKMVVYYDSGEGTLNRILEICVKYKLPIMQIENAEPNLEDIFLSLTGKTLRDTH